MIYLVILVVLLVAFLSLGGREYIGERLSMLFPVDYMRVGDKIDIFIDGKYNRTATISEVNQGSIVIYERLSIPVGFKGSFYATGYDQIDGNKLVYIKTRKHYKFVRAAELVRTLFNVLDDRNNLVEEAKQDVEEVEDDL